MNKRLLLIVTVLYIIMEYFLERYSMYSLFIWLLFAGIYTGGKYVTGKSGKKYLYLLGFLLFFILSTFAGSNLYKGFTDTIYEFRCFVPILVYDIIRNEDTRFKRTVVFVSFLCILLYTFQANQIIELVGSEYGLRGVSTQHEDDYLSTAFAFIYSLPIFCCSIVCGSKILFGNKNNWMAFLFLVILVYPFLLVFKSLFVTAMVFTIVGITMAFFYKRGDESKKWVLKSGIAVLVIVILFLLGFNYIVEYVGIMGNQGTVSRMFEMQMALNGQMESTGDMADRSDLIQISINTFFSNPLFGVHHRMVGVVDETIIGNHSQWIDSLAEFGLFANLAFVFLFKSLVQQFEDTKVIIPILVFSVLGFFNPIIYPITSLVAFLLCPLIIDISINNLKVSRHE